MKKLQNEEESQKSERTADTNSSQGSSVLHSRENSDHDDKFELSFVQDSDSEVE